ncbi:MAG: NADH-quinone oxidoreductase subunit N [Candidatus Wallbacteria bacterium]
MLSEFQALLYHLSPIITLLITAIIILALSTIKTPAGASAEEKIFFHDKILRWCESFTIIGFIVTFSTSVFQFLNFTNEISLFDNAVSFDNFSIFSNVFYSVMGIFTVFLSNSSLNSRQKFIKCEYYALILFAAIGAMIMTMGADLIVILIGIEIMSLSVYIMAALDIKNIRGAEGAFKYFLMGAVASAFFLFGLAHIYGICGSTYLCEIKARFSLNNINGNSLTIALTGAAFIISAMFFKIAAVPFHSWTPDAYDGASLPVTAFMTYFVKAAGFLMLYRVTAAAFINFIPYMANFIAVIAAVTMTYGNITALFQQNLKRMLAYSTISHTGYLLLAILALNFTESNPAANLEQAGAYLIFYLISYFLINAALFSALNTVKTSAGNIYLINDLKGLAYKNKLPALIIALALFALAGIPATSGFMAKFFVFYTAFSQNFFWLILIAVINSLIAVYYYLGLTIKIYMEKPLEKLPDFEAENTPESKYSFYLFLTMCVSAFLILFTGIYPEPILKIARAAIFKIF